MEKRILGPEPTPVASIILKFPNVKDMDNEDRLDLQFVPLEPDTAEIEIDECNNYLKTLGGTLEPQVDEILNEHFETLFIESSKMRPSSESYVTGLKVLYGLVDQKIIPVYQVVYLHRTTAGAPGSHSYTARFGLHYVYNSIHEFCEAHDCDFGKIMNYRNSIQIKRQSGSYTQFNSVGDVEGVIFPFQTIYTLINDNASSSVFLYNAIRFDHGEAKHCVLLTTQAKPFISVLTDKYANRSHLCPPCTVEYNVYTLKP